MGELADELASMPPYPEHPGENSHQSNGRADRQGKSRIRDSKTNGRFKTLNNFVDHSARLVDPTAQSVWVVLYREVRPNGLACISFSQIAELIGRKRRTVIRAMKVLEKAKLVTVVKRGRLNEGPSTYQVHGTPSDAG
jgi:CRP-like cAMP-binding protein